MILALVLYLLGAGLAWAFTQEAQWATVPRVSAKDIGFIVAWPACVAVIAMYVAGAVPFVLWKRRKKRSPPPAVETERKERK